MVHSFSAIHEWSSCAGSAGKRSRLKGEVGVRSAVSEMVGIRSEVQFVYPFPSRKIEKARINAPASSSNTILCRGHIRN
jgi:hypothetical protein